MTKRDRTEGEFFDCDAMRPMPIKIRSFANKYLTIQYVILPEIFSEVLMENDCIEYKEAAKNLYDGTPPTVQHIITLLADRVGKAFEVQGYE